VLTRHRCTDVLESGARQRRPRSERSDHRRLVFASSALVWVIVVVFSLGGSDSETR